MKITIKNSICQITPLPNNSVSCLLDRKLSYKMQGAEFMPNPKWAIVHLYRKKTGKFPIGFLNFVCSVLQKYCPDEKIQIDDLNKCSDVQYKEISLIKDLNLRDYQRCAIQRFILERRGIIALATGLGKTRTALGIINELKLKTMIIVHTKDLS